MAHRNQAHPFGWLAVTAASALMISASACSGELNIPPGGNGSGAAATNGGTGGSTGMSGGAAGSGTMNAGGMTGVAGSSPASGGSAGTGTGGSSTTACVGTEVTVPKRLIRLSFNQIANSITTLFGEAATRVATANVEIPSPLGRTFPPLGSGTEGNLITDTQWSPAIPSPTQSASRLRQLRSRHRLRRSARHRVRAQLRFRSRGSCVPAPAERCGADATARVFEGVLGDGGSVRRPFNTAFMRCSNRRCSLPHRVRYRCQRSRALAPTSSRTRSLFSSPIRRPTRNYSRPRRTGCFHSGGSRRRSRALASNRPGAHNFESR